MATRTGNRLYDVILESVLDFPWSMHGVDVDVRSMLITWPADLAGAIHKAVSTAQRETLGAFIRCTDRMCHDGEFEGKAEERGWGSYGTYWFCPNHKEGGNKR